MDKVVLCNCFASHIEDLLFLLASHDVLVGLEVLVEAISDSDLLVSRSHALHTINPMTANI